MSHDEAGCASPESQNTKLASQHVLAQNAQQSFEILVSAWPFLNPEGIEVFTKDAAFSVGAAVYCIHCTLQSHYVFQSEWSIKSRRPY